MLEFFHRLKNYFVPESHKTDVLLYKKAENIVEASLIGMAFLVLLLPANIYLELTNTLLTNFICVALLVASLFAFKKELPVIIFGNILSFLAFLLVLVATIETGGIYSPVISSFLVAGIIAFLYAGNFLGILWTILIVFTILTFAVLEYVGYKFSSAVIEHKLFFYTMVYVVLLGFVIYLIRFYVNILKNISKRNFLKTEKMEKYNQVLAQQQELIEKKNKELLKLYEDYDRQNKDLLLQKELLQTQNDELNRAYAELIDSVYYTKRIQEALLPSVEVIKPHFRDFMILYKPKEILSGDFYWFAEINQYLFLAVADCTGHGIPGAFMTVIGNDLLNRIIKEDYIFAPAEILKKLDKELHKTLQKESRFKADIISDGMDIALCRIDKESNEINFAGAKRPLFIANEGGVQEIKGSRFGIGGSSVIEKYFEEHRLIYSEDDVFYMSSDGFTDQFGGEYDTKFLTVHFKEKLKLNYHKPLEYQRLYLNELHETWRGYINEQTDDILVVGFRI
ncbi:SpoIIE family protein phosphatase [Raineya orbicola]|jgi:serine phosphatase RsbU (regulator of sigma subunit)|uniref:Stage II sporulation protein E (SpoIIE) n=1 Tax=Raineya orbicola TaxID=2016530 RepID=A0A2N3IA84_9BACT|nr:SpoIIE family protein phosphatase [Raineya orbicola]PKQ67241.1 Stage II sporulation protein E (SpoIIE) [Raineya orbicola]